MTLLITFLITIFYFYVIILIFFTSFLNFLLRFSFTSWWPITF